MLSTPGIGVLAVLIFVLLLSLFVIRVYVTKAEDLYRLSKFLFFVFGVQSLLFWAASFIIHEAVVFAHTFFFKVVNTATIFSGAFFVNEFIDRDLWARLRRSKTRVPTFIKSVVTVMVYLLAIAMVIHFIFVKDESSLVVFTGASALLFGYAAKEIIAHIFAALALSLSPSFQEGDLIIIDDKTLKVDQMSWRFVRLVDSKNQKYYVPNSSLVEKSIVNLSQMGGKTKVEIVFEMSLLDDPKKVEALVKKGFAKISNYNPEEEIFMAISKVQNCFEFTVRVPIKDLEAFGQIGKTKTELYVMLWKILRDNNIHFYINEMHAHDVSQPTKT
ncbi:MAG: mechanosensitive ion channel [Alphaproteobacteria bacterium]|nr:MAG: mechanosensitive ion channel [Alphaproteobacteria bacterium]